MPAPNPKIDKLHNQRKLNRDILLEEISHFDRFSKRHLIGRDQFDQTEAEQPIKWPENQP